MKPSEIRRKVLSVNRTPSLIDLRKRVMMSKGKGLCSNRYNSRQKERSDLTFRSTLSPSPQKDEMEQARMLSRRQFAIQDIEVLGGWLEKQNKASIFGIRAPSNKRYFRLVYNKRICEWTLRWFKDEWEEKMIKGVSLSGAQVRVVHDDRAARISPKLRSIVRNVSIRKHNSCAFHNRMTTFEHRHHRVWNLSLWKRRTFCVPQSLISNKIESIQTTVLDCYNESSMYANQAQMCPM